MFREKPILLMAMTMACLAVCALSFGHDSQDTTASKMEARREFAQHRFGMFIHWGIYSVLGEGEWVMNDKKIPISEYEKLAKSFNPTSFDAKQWVQMAKIGGMKYITFTAKHHDGFAMWDSKTSDYNVVKRTPFARDVVKELADECRRQGIKLFLYYSQLDWHHPDFYPRGATGPGSGRPDTVSYTHLTLPTIYSV